MLVRSANRRQDPTAPVWRYTSDGLLGATLFVGDGTPHTRWSHLPNATGSAPSNAGHWVDAPPGHKY
ncbi:hypothetical protein RDE2_53020 (plasmid) [Rhodococcus sp. RDE2]|nr:hypothetical protein RDE2_53020 [Rhodococcus sp. RDE2]